MRALVLVHCNFLLEGYIYLSNRRQISIFVPAQILHTKKKHIPRFEVVLSPRGLTQPSRLLFSLGHVVLVLNYTLRVGGGGRWWIPFLVLYLSRKYPGFSYLTISVPPPTIEICAKIADWLI